MTKEEAIDRLKNMAWIYGSAEREQNIEAVDMAIKALQTDAVHGEWKIDEYGIYHCPFCHAINNTVYKSFCPNCGTKMDKGGDTE